MKIYVSIGLLLLAVAGLSSCGEDPNVPKDTATTGSVSISVDETYQPIIKEQLKVFDSSYPDAHITAHYKAESECIKDLLENRARIALVTRPLNAEELKYCERNSIAPTSVAIARDALAIIVNNSATDTALTLEQLTGILTGQYKKKYTVVFDHEGSSTVRYMTDSLLYGQKLGPNVFAAKGNAAVVDYVAKNADAIGIVGVGFATDEDATTTDSFTSKVRVVAIKDPKTGEYNKPYQAYIALQTYPLYRHLYYINRETWQGLGSGFANFMSNEPGQLIFWHANLIPLIMQIQIRDAQLH